MRDKSTYSFLIAFARQLAAALNGGDSDDDVAIAVESLATSLVVLLADSMQSPDGDPAGVLEGVDDDDAPGPDTPLGAALARIAELERDRAAALDVTKRRLVGGASVTAGQLDVAGKRRRAPVLTKGAKRRGKK